MSLTRSVIFEKSMFARYTHPKDVPQYMWDYAYLLMNKDCITTEEKIRLYIDIVLVPLSQLKTYTIDGPTLFIKNNSKRWTFGIQSVNRNLFVKANFNRDFGFIKSLTFQIWTDVSWNPELRNEIIE